MFRNCKSMATLNRIKLSGFRSIKKMDLELRGLNVLIGANGAGKSNLISFFKMINEMMGSRLQGYIAKCGRAQSVLHFGPKVTPQMEATLEFATDQGIVTYHTRLFHAAGDTLVFAEEELRFLGHDWQGPPKKLDLGTGHLETRIVDKAEQDEPTAKTFRYLLNNCRVFHFHDTSETAGVRRFCYVGHDHPLMPDAANLAAVLYRLRKDSDQPAYRRIVSTIRRIAPFFDDFDLVPSQPHDRDITLNWRPKGSEQVFGPHQLSDGTLRAMSLITLLLQPVDELPNLIVVDEPELGLHPSALAILAGLFQKASHHCQVIIATQSVPLLDGFDVDDIVVVEQNGGESNFHRLDSDELTEWLKEYTVGELWEKNVLGGGPLA